jgi:hypothetical protein
MARWRGYIILWLIFSGFSLIMACIRVAQRVMLVGWESEIFTLWRPFVVPPVAAAVVVVLLAWLATHFNQSGRRRDSDQ